MKIVLKKALGLYRVLLSPAIQAMGVRCRFYPSCSEYASEAIDKRPFVEAAGLIAKRLLKCGPWNEGGIDHVPAK
jgi:putative membrane protein insertion efficiency factor